jgi:hypothetical protein
VVIPRFKAGKLQLKATYNMPGVGVMITIFWDFWLFSAEKMAFF